MKQLVTLTQNVYKSYNQHVGILMPAIGVTALCLLFIHRIPYINLYAQETLTTILFIDWLIVVILAQMHEKTQLSIAMLLIVFTFVLRFLKLNLWADTTMNVVYLILVLICLFIVKNQR